MFTVSMSVSAIVTLLAAVLLGWAVSDDVFFLFCWWLNQRELPRSAEWREVVIGLVIAVCAAACGLYTLAKVLHL